MARDISEQLRRPVAERAGYRCEYCFLHEDDSYSPHQVDHIIGRDIGSLDTRTGEFVRLFHPRCERWEDHFAIRGVVIEPLIPEGQATARLLKLNLDKRVVERRMLSLAGRYPR